MLRYNIVKWKLKSIELLTIIITLKRLKLNKIKTSMKSIINVGYLSLDFSIAYNCCLVVVLKNAAYNTCLVVVLKNAAYNTYLVVA
jgi:hypothetical protein